MADDKRIKAPTHVVIHENGDGVSAITVCADTVADAIHRADNSAKGFTRCTSPKLLYNDKVTVIPIAFNVESDDPE